MTLEIFEISVVSEDPNPSEGIFPLVLPEPHPDSSGMQPQAAKPEDEVRRS